MKNILIIGGEGYIGNSLIDYFLKKKYKITSFDNLIYRQKNRKKTKNYDFIFGDLRNKKDFKKINNKLFDAVVILAGLVGDPITNKYKKISLEINEKSIKEIVQNIYKNDLAKKLIFVSTCSNYGVSKKKYINETHKLKPLSPYAKSKVKVEKFILGLKRKPNFNPTILRFATAFGLSKRMRYDLTVNEFTKSLFKNKYLEVYDYNTWRPYCHVKDFARLINKVILAKNNKTTYQVFNAGSNQNNFSKKMISEMIKKMIGGKINYLKKSKDKRNYIVDFTKVKKILNFKIKFSIKYGIKEIIQDLKVNQNNLNNSNLGNYKIKLK